MWLLKKPTSLFLLSRYIFVKALFKRLEKPFTNQKTKKTFQGEKSIGPILRRHRMSQKVLRRIFNVTVNG